MTRRANPARPYQTVPDAKMRYKQLLYYAARLKAGGVMRTSTKHTTDIVLTPRRTESALLLEHSPARQVMLDLSSRFRPKRKSCSDIGSRGSHSFSFSSM